MLCKYCRHFLLLILFVLTMVTSNTQRMAFMIAQNTHDPQMLTPATLHTHTATRTNAVLGELKALNEWFQ